MKKLIRGIVDFAQAMPPGYREHFAKLALGQTPDSLLILCSDSRVAANYFASTDPGDLFVVRNVGNLIPPCGEHGRSTADESEAAAIEFAIDNLSVRHIIVCGHSECGAMHALLSGREQLRAPNLRSWLRHGETALVHLHDTNSGPTVEFPAQLSSVNRLSQLNVISQLEHLQSYPIVADRLKKATLTLHGWWFDIKSVAVHRYAQTEHKFVPIEASYLDRFENESFKT